MSQETRRIIEPTKQGRRILLGKNVKVGVTIVECYSQ